MGNSFSLQWVNYSRHANSGEGSDQTAHTHRLIGVFAGRTCVFVRILMRRLKYFVQYLFFYFIHVLLRWVKEAWESLTSEIIVRSFKKTGISNMLDGIEDDDLWQPSNSDEDDDELEFPGTIPKHFFL